MATVNGAIRINKPVDEVFSYVSNPRNLPSWDRTVNDVRFSGPVSAGRGGTIIRQFNGKGHREEFEIHALESNRVLEIDGYSDHLWFQTVVRFQPTDGGTEVAYSQTVHGDGLTRLFKPLAPRSANARVSESFGHLKQALEGRRAEEAPLAA